LGTAPAEDPADGGSARRGAGGTHRIAGEIHDILIQGVVGISANVELVAAELEDSPESARTLLDRLRILISHTLDEARRSVWNLRPASLEQRNLASALQDSAREAALNTPSR
jgi:signal transduction histidine kinase